MKKGFTLAEVLITLAIIGIVAALTIPGLIEDYKKREYVTRLQKGISVLNNGFNLMMADEGVNEIDLLELQKCNPRVVSYYGDTQKCLQPYFKKYFNIITDNAIDDPREFYPWQDVTPLSGSDNTLLGYLGFVAYYNFITGDGILYVPFSFTTIGDALIDVNGTKGPNQIGRDIFCLKNENGIFVPRGIGEWDDSASTEYCNPAAENSVGYGCAARIAAEGWKMNY